MRVPRSVGSGQVRKNICAVKDVAGTVGVDDPLPRHPQGGQYAVLAAFVVPEEAVLAHRDAADPAAATTQITEHFAGRKVHLLAQPLGDSRDIDKPEQVMGIRAQAAAVE